MPRIGMSGAMSARSSGFLGSSARPTTFVLQNTYFGSNPSVAMGWAGAQAGDLAIVFSNNDDGGGGGLTGPAGWAVDSYTTPSPYYTQSFYRVLTSADISNGSATWTGAIGAMTAVLAVYRGPSTLTKKSTAAATGTTDVSLAGFTKSVTSAGIVTVCYDRVVAETPTTPSGFLSRVSAHPGGNFKVCLADILTPADYTNGTTVTWSGFNSGSFEHSGWLVELT